MLKMVIAIILAIATGLSGASVSAQTDDFEPVELTKIAAANALDAMPAMFAIAQNYEGGSVSGDTEGLVTGFAGLSDFPEAQNQLSAAVGAYGFESYPDWVATIRTILSTYAYVQTVGAREQMAPSVDAAMQKVMNDPNIPQAQKDAIAAQLGTANDAMSQIQATPPSAVNQAVVIALLPLVGSTIQTMQAMQ